MAQDGPETNLGWTYQLPAIQTEGQGQDLEKGPPRTRTQKEEHWTTLHSVAINIWGIHCFPWLLSANRESSSLHLKHAHTHTTPLPSRWDGVEWAERQASPCPTLQKQCVRSQSVQREVSPRCADGSSCALKKLLSPNRKGQAHCSAVAR